MGDAAGKRGGVGHDPVAAAGGVAEDGRRASGRAFYCPPLQLGRAPKRPSFRTTRQCLWTGVRPHWKLMTLSFRAFQ